MKLFFEIVLTNVAMRYTIVTTSTEGEKVNSMTEKERKILDTFRKIIPKLSDLEKEKLLSFGEGMAFKVDQMAG